MVLITTVGLPWWVSDKESPCQCGRHRFDPWSGTLPHAVEQTKPVHYNYWACALEPGSYSCWARVLCGARALQQEKPLQWDARAVPACRSQRRAHMAREAQRSQKQTKLNKTTVSDFSCAFQPFVYLLWSVQSYVHFLLDYLYYSVLAIKKKNSGYESLMMCIHIQWGGGRRTGSEGLMFFPVLYFAWFFFFWKHLFGCDRAQCGTWALWWSPCGSQRVRAQWLCCEWA